MNEAKTIEKEIMNDPGPTQEIIVRWEETLHSIGSGAFSSSSTPYDNVAKFAADIARLHLKEAEKRIEHASAEAELRRLKVIEMGKIALEEEGGKPKFPNERLREAELQRRLDSGALKRICEEERRLFDEKERARAELEAGKVLARVLTALLELKSNP